MYHEFLGFVPTDESEVLILSVARLYECLNTIVQQNGVQEGRGGERQKLYRDTFGRILPLAISQLIGSMLRSAIRRSLNSPTSENCGVSKQITLEHEKGGN